MNEESQTAATLPAMRTQLLPSESEGALSRLQAKEEAIDAIPVEPLAGTAAGEPEDGQAAGGDGGLPVAVSAPDGSVSRECGDGPIEAEITRVFGAVAGQACRVAACESGTDMDGRLDGNFASSGSSWGVFQINQIHAARFPEFWERWFEVEYNVMMAHTLFVEHGYSWQPWSCSWAAY